ncbi:MAG TPA: alpha/beta fold hydrolase [Candidatus Binatia bacterium]|jgi:putative phosphoribosyl transferase|nr:alpha/beta fold hydrolase [Candidatus Binatia bacterium]
MEESLKVPTAGVELEAALRVPERAKGLVVFAHGAGSDRKSPRNLMTAERLDAAGYATLLFDLLTPPEKEEYGANVFDIGKLTDRLAGVIAWAGERPGLAGLRVALLGASTGAAAALNAAARLGDRVAAVVSRGGRPDLADQARLGDIAAATVFIVGSEDKQVLEASRPPFARLRCDKDLRVIEGATHVFEEPGTLEAATDAAVEWIARHLP